MSYYLIQISLWDCNEDGCDKPARQNLCNARNLDNAPSLWASGVFD